LKIQNLNIFAMNKLLLFVVSLLYLTGSGTAADDMVSPSALNWIDSDLWTMGSGIFVLLYEFLVLKLPTNKTLSLIGNLYKLLTRFIPDKSANGGKFVIKD